MKAFLVILSILDIIVKLFLAGAYLYIQKIDIAMEHLSDIVFPAICILLITINPLKNDASNN